MDTNQLNNAKGIVRGVKAKKLSRGKARRATTIALETAITESGLRNYANGNNPESMKLPHQAVGWDHGSVGLFQQQVGGAVNSTANWGTTRELMNPTIACEKFLNALLRTNWLKGSRWMAAQNVQRSAFPDGSNYHHNDALAADLMRKLYDSVTLPAPGRSNPPAWPHYMGDHDYFGLVTGPAHSHGGYYADERPAVKLIQQKLQKLGYAPKAKGWADGIYGLPTRAAVIKFQHARMPHTTHLGAIWQDDWKKLMSL